MLILLSASNLGGVPPRNAMSKVWIASLLEPRDDWCAVLLWYVA